MKPQLNRSSSKDRSSPTTVTRTDSVLNREKPNADVAESLEFISRNRKTEKQHADLYCDHNKKMDDF